MEGLKHMEDKRARGRLWRRLGPAAPGVQVRVVSAVGAFESTWRLHNLHGEGL